MISQRAVDLIVSCEVSSRKTYENNYRHPEWPGGASGVTIAIGYDLGYADLAKLHADWQGRVPDDMLKVMARCLGVRGDDARRLLPSVRSEIEIPWDAAMEVFLHRDVPQWTDRVIKSIPLAAKLSPDSLGALVSLAYNRGSSFDAPGDRYREMRGIKQHTQAGEPQLDPPEIRAMKRLWPSVHGLQVRRDAEAKLFSDGLIMSGPAAELTPNETPKPLPPAPAGKEEHGSAAGAAAGAGKTIQETVPAEHIWTWLEIALAIGGAVTVGIIIWLIVRAYRKAQPVTAREKDHPQ